MMHPFLCYRCLQVSNSAEGLHCLHCGADGPGTIMTANSYYAIPESADAGPVYYITIEDASTQVSEEDLEPEEQTREASTQVSEEDLEPEEQTREASTQTSDDDLTFEESHGFENCLESDGTSQVQASYDFDHYTIVNQNGITHSNEGEFPNQSYDICNAANLQEVMDFKPSTTKHSCVGEQSSLGENESRSDYQFLTRRGPKEAVDGGIMSDSFTFTDSRTLESKCPAGNLFLYSSEKAEDKQDKGRIPFSSYPSGDPSVNKCFPENLPTLQTMAQNYTKTSKKLKIFICTFCKRHFMKESSFIAHKNGYCNNSEKLYKCGECGRICQSMSKLLVHRRVHTVEKPFKCTQCVYATRWKKDLKKHLKKHTNIARSLPFNKDGKTEEFPKLIWCKKCRKYFFSNSKFICSCPK